MLSRNKVAVPEGAAGTPPFWSRSFGMTNVNVDVNTQRVGLVAQVVRALH